MRLFPIVTAAVVVVVLFFAVLQRDRLIAFATGQEAEPDIPEQVAEIADTPEPAERLVHVVARASVAEDVDNAVRLRGQTEAAREVVVRAETSGLIVSEPLRKGAYVNAGDLLCRLDPGTRQASLAEAEARLLEARARVPEAQARVAEAEARLEEARINQTAASRLGESGFASTTRVANADASLSSAEATVQAAKSGLESATAGIQGAEAALRRAQNDLQQLDIRAPFSGVLETDTAELGALLQPGAACATVFQLDPIKLVGFVPETEVDLIKVGARAGARLIGGQDVMGRVTFLSRSADDLTRTFRVEIEVANTDLSIRDGQTVEILVQSEGKKAHLLPASVLTLNDGGELGVRWVDDTDHARFAPVTLLRDTPNGVWLAGLPDEVTVILVGQEYVIDGVKVDVSFEELTQ